MQRGPLPDNAVVKMAQTFRSGTNDIDAIDYVEMFLDDEGQTNPEDLNDVYVLVNFRPVVTKKEIGIWTCGVAGYDNALRPAAVLPDATAFRGLHLSLVDPARRNRRRARRCRAEPHQEQLHAQSALGGNLQ